MLEMKEGKQEEGWREVLKSCISCHVFKQKNGHMPFFLFTAVFLSKYNTHSSRTYSCSGPFFESRPHINTSFPLVLPKSLNLVALRGTRSCDNNPWLLDVVFERINKVCEALPEG